MVGLQTVACQIWWNLYYSKLTDEKIDSVESVAPELQLINGTVGISKLPTDFSSAHLSVYTLSILSITLSKVLSELFCHL